MTKTTQIGARFPEDLADKMKEAAIAEGRSVSSYLIRLVERDLIQDSIKAATTLNAAPSRLSSLATTQQALDAEAALFFDASPLPRALVSLDGTLLRVNEAFAYWVGYAPDTLVGMTFYQITVPEDRKKGAEAIQDILARRITHIELEKRYLHKSGMELPAKVVSHPIYQNGSIASLASTIIPRTNEH